MLCAEVSVYPLKTNNATQVIDGAIEALSREQVKYKVGSISTHIDGNDEQVWSGIRKLYDEAKKTGEVNMVVTFSNAEH
ncbi:hypothetical protein Sgly_0239 [Syntrophobotulus glycolicus DSM 8271]|uniref:Thiamine-binding protein domain-containing protein n=1 Tax=Syntrophobotulus glycolicus (strain DSM 8271 / FlGlyR) TaxID=645991 RepID=F0SWR8_SYNGF|nr:YkoF family thiamine/hydroxymethylpyrimidine-binding protein [Syntrophobotulus glycolicus]ADY54608.1 hypothetical protein Sgly_0239 [Syntrophobotulus glycolicus DSM 8271]